MMAFSSSCRLFSALTTVGQQANPAGERHLMVRSIEVKRTAHTLCTKIINVDCEKDLFRDPRVRSFTDDSNDPGFDETS